MTFWKSRLFLWPLSMSIVGIILVFILPTQMIASTKIGAVTPVESFIAITSEVLEIFKLDVGRYPTTLEGLSALLSKPNRVSYQMWKGPYSVIKLDSWGYQYQYISPGVHNQDSFDLFSVGRDGIEGTIDDINNWDENKSWREYYAKNPPKFWQENPRRTVFFIIVFLVILFDLISSIQKKQKKWAIFLIFGLIMSLFFFGFGRY